MKFLYLSLLFFVYGNHVYAHESNEAFFNFIIKDSIVEVEAEFPWTMRNALLKFNPSLKNSTSKNDFEKTFVDYIKTNLILKDENENPFHFIEYKELAKDGHSHQNNYSIKFQGSNLSTVTNTLMFNLYENQVNYNKVTFKSGTKTFKTKKSIKNFNLNERKELSNYWYLLLLLIPLFYFIYSYFKQQSTNNI